MTGQIRDAARTRRALLDAAARSVGVHGAGVTLDVVAREAGVSKGGLMHHFGSKDELLTALVDDLFEEFARAVQEQVDPDDDAPGKLLRGYVRATFDELERGSDAVEQTTLMATLSSLPGLARRSQDRYRRWNETLAGDGVDRQRVLLVLRACDGVSIAPLFEGAIEPDELADTRELLLRLTRDTGPLVELL
ncbi:TetR/AcrR family transcriptional regulator [Blastococcus sp. BMG 814]|uniref:TetR/AcrR family transcriptional regulator n=1 Tax=Blastococcus carthaginiensis TaxID=3050034 RepID=A0ABT9IEJ7_9ACTN|nr:TetR/AcrR family transcriptional regulator [Blastococcus carthaginiensis]MDP5183612.1 TetR/AcrR family transcriptional regulator [Blastococcus carthaginiensis]